MLDSIERASAQGTALLPRWLLLAGLVAGAGIAASGLVRPGNDDALPANAVARVNDRLILRDTWLRAVAAVAGERRAPLSDADRRHILDRLIDEELLVQHGVALGLPENDARLRDTLVSEVMLSATGAEARVADDAELGRFYADNTAFFAPTQRLRVRAWRVRDFGERVPFQPLVPDAPLPLAKIQAYLGPALTARADQLEVGRESEPIATPGGAVVLQVLDKQVGAIPPFERARDQVRAEFKRRADEAAVRGLLENLRRGARLRVETVSP